MTLLNEVQHIPTRFKDIVLEFIKTHPDIWDQLETMFAKETTIYGGEIQIFPSRQDIFRCFHFFEPEETQVVLIGQDPYHGLGQATGLCFGVNENIPIPPSLRNINKEMKSDLGRGLDDQTLEKWAKQGVLMLNSSLTVRQGNASSHMKFWLPFTKYIIQKISEHCENVVFLVWGAFAHKQVQETVDWDKHSAVITSHPSPLSATRAYKNFPSFIGSRPFTSVNSFLKKEIQW